MGDLFGGSPPVPKPPPPTPMPDLMDPAILAAKRRESEAAQSRSGRASTFLSDGDYSDTKLGKG